MSIVINQKVQEIKRLKRESLILRSLMIVLSKMSIKSPLLSQISFNKINLGNDKSVALVYIYSNFGKETAQAAIKVLISYQKQIHSNLCSELQFRYMPKLKFVYDVQYEKVLRINEVIEKAMKE
jgi:ribosome-binding factor A